MKTTLTANDQTIEVEIPEEQLKKIMPKSKRWRAEEDQSYWYIDSGGSSTSTTEVGVRADDFHYKTGNYFATEEQAEKYRNYLLAIASINEFIEKEGLEFSPDWEDERQRKYYIYCFRSSTEFIWSETFSSNVQVLLLLPYFKSQEDAQKVINNCKNHLEVIRQYLT